jgi:hypothetical protein
MADEVLARERVVKNLRANVARIEDHYRRLWDVPGENNAGTGDEERGTDGMSV